MSSSKKNKYTYLLTDGNSTVPTAKNTKDKKSAPERAGTARRTTSLFGGYLALSLVFFLLGAAVANLFFAKGGGAYTEIISAHFSTVGVSKTLFTARIFAARVLPVVCLCIGALTFFSGGVSAAVLAVCSAVFGIGTCAVLTFDPAHSAEYILWSILLIAEYIACAIFARKFFIHLFVDKNGYGNVRSLWVYLGICFAFLLILLLISVIYTLLLYGGSVKI
ncbi:MAG: hypothetical protein IJX74_01840 [Clostridia bacterium]|nr:hypothetical protein [Clostridia bacterium]